MIRENKNAKTENQASAEFKLTNYMVSQIQPIMFDVDKIQLTVTMERVDTHFCIVSMVTIALQGMTSFHGYYITVNEWLILSSTYFIPII